MLKSPRQATRLAAVVAVATTLATTGAVAVGAEQDAANAPGGRTLAGTYWKAIELGGKPITSPPVRKPHLLFKPEGRVSGSDGCNRISGSYELKKDAITFGAVASTRMACTDIGDVDRAFGQAISRARRFRIVGDRLELSDADGKRVAVFRAVDQAHAPNRP